jgi:endonuclease/exonuclease/phosphatase family metal-dependent hydrolase
VKKLTVIFLTLLASTSSGVPALTLPSQPGISIVTLNLAKEASVARIQSEFQDVPALREADIFLLQEVSERPANPCVANRLGEALGLYVAYAPNRTVGSDLGLAILSRFPLRNIQIRELKRFDLLFRTRSRYALLATAETPWGPLRLSNAHLDTRLNTRDRLSQLEPVVQESASFNGPGIIGGDFNSNPFYWIGHVLPVPGVRSQAQDVSEYMTKHGFLSALSKPATTFDHMGMGLDWIWLDRLRPLASGVVPLGFSDHHAVWTRVAF